MRFLPTFTAFVLATSTLTVAPQLADACGGYGDFMMAAPRIHRVALQRTYQGGNWKIGRADDGNAPKTFTLVGPSGRRIVNATTVAKQRSDDFRIALEGPNHDVRWVELGELGYTVKQHSSYVARFDLVQGDAKVATYEGRAVGALAVGWRTYLVVQHAGTTTAHWIA